MEPKDTIGAGIFPNDGRFHQRRPHRRALWERADHSAVVLSKSSGIMNIILIYALRRRTQSKNPSPDREERFPSTAKKGPEWACGCDADERVWADSRRI